MFAELLPMLAKYGVAGIGLFFFTLWIVSRTFHRLLLFALSGLLWVFISALVPKQALFLWYIGSLIYLLLALMLLSNFTRAMERAEALNCELNERLLSTQRELRQHFDELAALETRNALEQERTRIYRDLHDDIGAGLLSLIHRTESHERRLARQALQHLRDIVSINTRTKITLVDVLADISTECLYHAENQQAELNWQQSERLPEIFLQKAVILALRRGFRALFVDVEPQWKRISIAIESSDVELKIGVQGEPSPGESLVRRFDAHLNSAGGEVRIVRNCMQARLSLIEVQENVS